MNVARRLMGVKALAMRKTGPSAVRRICPTSFRVAKRGTLREINRQIALNLIRSRQPISRAELARVMGVRRGAISRLVDELLRAGLVFEGAKGDSRRGRKPTHLFLETRKGYALAVDLTATCTSLMATDVLGRPLLGVMQFATKQRPASLVRELARHVGRIVREHRDLGKCVGIGLAVPGVVDTTGRYLKFSPTLAWHGVDIASPLEAATGLPVVMENSCKACVLAEVWSVRGETIGDGPVVFVNVSDGVGVGIAVDGKLLRGAHNIAGELGHVPLDPSGPRCACGQSGCWESYISRRAVLARYLKRDASWPASAAITEITLKEVIGRGRAGERRAVETLRETGRHLGRGLALILKAIDPRRIYVGGELTKAWHLMESEARQAIREETFLREAGEPEILIVPLGEYPRLRGAAALVITAAFAAPVVA
jgi:predicted NBD/HSP70 family sugar kinase